MNANLVLEAAAKKINPDTFPQVLVFCNSELVDEVILGQQGTFEIKQDLKLEEGWNEIQYTFEELSWGGGEYLIKSFDIDGQTAFPVDRGENIAPFVFEFNAANLVSEHSLLNEENPSEGLATHYEGLGSKGLSQNCNIRLCFKVKNEKIVDHYFVGQADTAGHSILNLSQNLFLTLIEMSLRRKNLPGRRVLKEYIELGSTSTAAKHWRLPLVLQPLDGLDLLVDKILSTPWRHATIYREYQGKLLPKELLVPLLVPPNSTNT